MLAGNIKHIAFRLWVKIWATWYIFGIISTYTKKKTKKKKNKWPPGWYMLHFCLWLLMYHCHWNECFTTDTWEGQRKMVVCLATNHQCWQLVKSNHHIDLDRNMHEVKVQRTTKKLGSPGHPKYPATDSPALVDVQQYNNIPNVLYDSSFLNFKCVDKSQYVQVSNYQMAGIISYVLGEKLV